MKTRTVLQLLSGFRTISHALFVAALVAWGPALLAEVAPPTLRTQLQEFAVAHKFVVHNLNRIDEAAPGKVVDSSVEERLELLLEGYSYLVLSGASGSIAEVRILGAKGRNVPPANIQPPPTTVEDGANAPQESLPSTQNSSLEYRIDTRREGHLQMVLAFLLGQKGEGLQVPLALDLDGTAVVLPASKSAELAIQLDDLEDGWAETANGEFPGKVTTLKMIRVEDVVSRDVQVVFVDDETLGPHALLGVGALKGFSTTVDEFEDEAVFVRKEVR